MPRYRGHFYNWYDTRTLAAAAAGLHLDRRQRQPRRLSAHAARRPGGARRARADRSTRRSLGLRRSRRSGAGGSRPRGRHCRRRRRAEPAPAARSGAAARHARRAPREHRRLDDALLRRLKDRMSGARRPAARDRGVAPGAAPQPGGLERGDGRGRLLARSRRLGDRRAAGRSAAPRAGAGGNRAPRRRRRPGRLAQPGGDRSPRPSRARRRHGHPRPRGRRPMRCRSRRSRSNGSSGSARSPTTSSRRPSSASSSTPERQLFSIGFNVAEGRLDNSYYDTLASEARLASFLAIATGKIAPRPLVQARTIADAQRAARARCSRGARRCSST